MGGQLGLIGFIMWRESVEALLVIGILNAWLMHEAAETVRGSARRYLWGGVLAGLGIAVALGAVLLFFADMLSDDAQDYFQIGMVLIAAVLILQMVYWMQRHGRTLKKTLHSELHTASTDAKWWSIFLLAAAAVAREGSETVVFLYGVLASGAAGGIMLSAFAALLGLMAAFATYWLLQASSRFFSWKSFFTVTKVMLLFLAASLFLTGIDRLIGLGVLPPLSGPLWDTSRFLDDSSPLGNFIAALTGYRAKPDLMLLLAYAGYWIAVFLLFRPHGNGACKAQTA